MTSEAYITNIAPVLNIYSGFSEYTYDVVAHATDSENQKLATSTEYADSYCV